MVQDYRIKFVKPNKYSQETKQYAFNVYVDLEIETKIHFVSGITECMILSVSPISCIVLLQMYNVHQNIILCSLI